MQDEINEKTIVLASIIFFTILTQFLLDFS